MLVEEFNLAASKRSTTSTSVRKVFWQTPIEGEYASTLMLRVFQVTQRLHWSSGMTKVKFLLLAAKPLSLLKAEIAKLKAIEWASTLAEEFGWKNVDWLCDAKSVVKQLNDYSEPCEWESWALVSSLKAKLKRNNWKVS